MNILHYLLAEVSNNPELIIGHLSLQIAVSICLLIVAGAMLFFEMLIVSGGILALISIACAAAACYLAYEVGPIFFWAIVLLTPTVGFFIIRVGISKLMNSSMVPQAEITDNAGYGHVAKSLGVEVGSTGALSTDAMPTGRGKFSDGELDVILQSGAGSKGDKIKVIEIDGPSVFVIKIQTEENA